MATVEAKIHAKLVDEASGKAREIAASLRTVEASASSAGARGSTAAREHAAALEQLTASEREAASAAAATEAHVERAALAHRQAASAAEQQATASARAGTAGNQAAGGFLKVDAAAKAQGRAVAENVNLLSEMALGFGALSPATRQAAIDFAGAGNNAFALANALGPIGPAIAVAIGLMPAAIAAWMRYSDSAKRAATAAREARQAFLDQVDAARQLRESEERERELLRGTRSVEEQRDALGVAREQATVAQRRSEALTTGQLGENSLAARIAEAVGGRGLRLAASQATGADLVSAVEGLARVMPTPGLAGAAQGMQNREEAEAARTSQRRDQLDTALGIASQREAREAERTRLQQQVEAAAAAQQLFEADLRRQVGPSASGQRRADQILAAAEAARRDESGRVTLDAAGSRALRGLPESERAAVQSRVAELLQAQRRADDAQRTMLREAAAPALAANATERTVSPTARPDVALRDNGAELAGVITRYIEAAAADPRAEASSRAMEEFARAVPELVRGLREINVNVRTSESGATAATPVSFAGVGTSGR